MLGFAEAEVPVGLRIAIDKIEERTPEGQHVSKTWTVTPRMRLQQGQMMSVTELRAWLDERSPGTVEYSDDLARPLGNIWDEFSGANAEGMNGHKLIGRMESITWEPPVLSFTIERHGGTARGSTRAELHKWFLNLDTMTAEIAPAERRQLYPMQPKLDVWPLAADLARVILEGTPDPRVRVRRDGAVQVVMSRMFMGDAKQTREGRGRRLRKALVDALGPGWNVERGNLFRKQRIPCDAGD